MIKVAVNGASGRMGRALCSLIGQSDTASLSVATVRPSSSLVGVRVSDVIADVHNDVLFSSSNQFDPSSDVVIDFTLPELAMVTVSHCVEHNTPIVIGTTGFDANQLEHIEQASKTIPIVLAANMSVGVTVALSLVELAAKALGGDYDTEIIEAHHRFKKDSPSGTALAFGQVIANTLDRPLEQHAVFGREGMIGERPDKEIGFSTVRGGDVIGDHTVMFLGDGDRLELTHKASNRDTFARGAVKAANWLATQPAGMYNMKDVLGLAP